MPNSQQRRPRSSCFTLLAKKKKKGPAADALAQLEALEAENEPAAVAVKERPPALPKKKKKKKKGLKGPAADALKLLEELEAEEGELHHLPLLPARYTPPSLASVATALQHWFA